MRVITGAEEAAASTAALDPTLLALLSIFGGALLTAAAGFWGAWRQSKREHTRWVRERRYEAYLDFVAMSRTYVKHRGINNELIKKTSELEYRRSRLADREANTDDPEEKKALEAEGVKFDAEVAELSKVAGEAVETLAAAGKLAVERTAPFHLLGPEAVTIAAASLGDAIAEPRADHEGALRKLEAEMRAALGIKDY